MPLSASGLEKDILFTVIAVCLILFGAGWCRAGQIVTYTPPPIVSVGISGDGRASDSIGGSASGLSGGARLPATGASAVTGGGTNLSSAGRSAITSDGKNETGSRLAGTMDKLMLTLAGSPLLVKVIARQLARYGNEKLRLWARESYFLVGQVIAEAERSGRLPGDRGAKARLYQQQFENILKQAGWMERAALRVTGREKDVVERAMREARQIHGKTFEAEVAALEADGKIGMDKALELLDVNRRGMMTPRELGAFLLTESDLKSPDILELMRTYVAKDAGVKVRVKGRRDSHFDATVLELLQPWRDPKRAEFHTRLNRRQVARILTFQGSVEDFARTIIAETGLSGDEAGRLVAEYAGEMRKNKAYLESMRKTTAQARRRSAGSSDIEHGRRNEAATGRHEEPSRERPVNSSAASESRPRPKQYDGAVRSANREKGSATIGRAGSGATQRSGTSSVVHGTATGGGARTAGKALHGQGRKSVAVAPKAPRGHSLGTTVAGTRNGPGTAAGRGTVNEVTAKPVAVVGGGAASPGDSGFPSMRSSSRNVSGAPPGTIGGGWRGMKQSLAFDAFRGGIFLDAGIAAAANLYGRLKQGQDLGKSIDGTLSALLTTEFLVGDLLGGTLGAALGAAIPVPGALAGMGLLGRFFGVLPGVSFALAGAQFGYGAVSLMKRGQFSFQALFNEVRPGLLICQAIGSAIGMTIGTVLLPGPAGALLGGLAGGLAGARLAAIIMGDDGAVSATLESLPSKASSTGRRAAGAASQDPELVDLNLTRPGTDDLVRLNESVRNAYEEYLSAQRRGDYRRAVVFLKKYGRLQKLLYELQRKGYRVGNY